MGLSILLNICFLAFPLILKADDNFHVPYAPKGIKFNSIEPLRSTDAANALSGMLAFTVNPDMKWQSLAPVNPFQRPEAIFVFDIIGVSENMDFKTEGTTFPLENLGNLDSQYDLLAFRTIHRYENTPEGRPIVLKLDASDELYAPKSEERVLMSEIPAEREARLELALNDVELSRPVNDGTFNISQTEDADFLIELETVKLLLKSLRQNKAAIVDGIPDVYWVQLKGLHSIVSQYGSDSFQAKEGTRLTQQIITETVNTMNEVYDNEAVVTVFSQMSPPASLIRKTRELLEDATTTPAPSKDNGLRLAYRFDENFAIAFATIAFTSIILILAVLSISVAMWFMDPGRDSIIYRMTSTRMKKD